MKSFRFGVLALIALVVAIGVTFMVNAVLAQRSTVEKSDGHRMPVTARVVFPNGTERKILIDTFEAGSLGRFQIHGEDPEGIDRHLWNDTIAAFEDTTADSARLILKDGSKVRLKMPFSLTYSNPDGGKAELRLAKVKSLKFLDLPRKDKEGHAMFDHWKYSPNTGEELPKVKAEGDANDK